MTNDELHHEFHPNPEEVQLEAVIINRIRQMGEHMHAEVKEGVVHLSGTTNEFETKRAVTTLVQGMGGVREVINNIRVTEVRDEEFHNYY